MKNATFAGHEFNTRILLRHDLFLPFCCRGEENPAVQPNLYLHRICTGRESGNVHAILTTPIVI